MRPGGKITDSAAACRFLEGESQMETGRHEPVTGMGVGQASAYSAAQVADPFLDTRHSNETERCKA